MAAPRLDAPPFHFSVLTASLLSALCMVSAPAVAQTAENSLSQIDVVDETPRANGRLSLDVPIETGSRLGLTARETPASVTVVDRTTIDARGAQDTQEILRAVPGITAHNAPGSVGVSYRGFSGGSLSQMFNGINVQYTIAARPVDSWIYDRVEVIGGPSSFLFGTGAVGGAINYVTKLAERKNFSEAQLRAGTYGLVNGSLGLNRQLAGAESGLGSHHVRLDVNAQDKGSWMEGTHSRSEQVAASLLSDFGASFSHTLALEHQHEKVDRPYWGTPTLNPIAANPAIDPRTRYKNYNSVDGLYEQTVQWVRSVADWKVSEQFSLRNTAYHYEALRDYRNVETYTFNATNTAVIRSSALLQRHDHEMTGDRIDAQFKGQLAGLRSDWAFGLDHSVNNQTRFPNSLSKTISTVDPVNFSTERFFDIPGMTPGFNPDRDNMVTTLSAYVENRTLLTPTLSVLTALQQEHVALDLINRRAVTAAAPATYHRSYQPTTGRLGVVWDVLPHANVYAQYATAADPPSGILSTAAFADVMANTDLTTGKSFELGSKLSFWQGKGTATAALYRITRKNISMKDPDDSNKTILVGQQSSQGIDLAVGITPTAAWEMQGNLSYVEAQYDQYFNGTTSLAGKALTGTPAVVANLWVSYALNPSLKASMGLRHVGERYADATNTISWPAYTTVDLGLSWKPAPNWTVSAQLRNATDEVYAASVGTARVYLAPPRTADVSVNVKF
jgi:iron complex outermembrane receptor protein